MGGWGGDGPYLINGGRGAAAWKTSVRQGSLGPSPQALPRGEQQYESPWVPEKPSGTTFHLKYMPSPIGQPGEARQASNSWNFLLAVPCHVGRGPHGTAVHRLSFEPFILTLNVGGLRLPREDPRGQAWHRGHRAS